MPDNPAPTVLQHLRRALGQAERAASDAQLLERFLAQRDPEAFELLVWRHERLVLSACRRILGDLHDAEDAFQATFLTLVRKARSIGRGQALASWLYRVACRIALRARAGRAGRERQGIDLTGLPAGDDAASERRELGPVLDEEVGRLPEKQRAAVVLCYLEGRTYAEAARVLGCPVGTVSTRLTHARERLRARLQRRGLGLGAAGLAAVQTAGEKEAPEAGGKAAPRTDQERVQGTWLVVALNMEHRELPEEEFRFRQFLFTGDRMTMKKSGRGAEQFTFKLDPTKKPKAISVYDDGGRLRGVGVYKFQGDRLQLCIGDDDEPRPTDFAPGKRRLVVVLKRAKGSANPGAGQRKKADPGAQAEPKTDKERLQGTWVGVSINARGEDVPAEQARAYRITFAGDRVKPKRPLDPAEDYPYRIDPTQKPKTIDFLARRAGLGIYEFEGDKLRLCLTDEDAPRPTDFKPGERHVVIVLRRAGVPTKAEEVADLKVQVKALRETLTRLRESNAFLKGELLKRTEESEARKDEIGGVLTRVDVSGNTVSLTLGRTKLALQRVPLSVRSKFILGLRECTINDLKPGMEVTLRLETNGERSEVVHIEAGPARKEE